MGRRREQKEAERNTTIMIVIFIIVLAVLGAFIGITRISIPGLGFLGVLTIAAIITGVILTFLWSKD